MTSSSIRNKGAIYATGVVLTIAFFSWLIFAPKPHKEPADCNQRRGQADCPITEYAQQLGVDRQLLDDEKASPLQRAEALVRLAGEHNDAILERIPKWASQTNPDMRKAAARALGFANNKAWAPSTLKLLLTDKDIGVFEEATKSAVSLVGDAISAVLTQRLESETHDELKSLLLAQSLSARPGRESTTQRIWTAFVSSKNEIVRMRAAQTLLSLQDWDQRVLEVYRNLMKTTNGGVSNAERIFAFRALALRDDSSLDPSVVESFLKNLDANSLSLTLRSIGSLCRVDRKKVLSEYADNKDSPGQYAAKLTLEEIRHTDPCKK